MLLVKFIKVQESRFILRSNQLVRYSDHVQKIVSAAQVTNMAAVGYCSSVLVDLENEKQDML